MTDTHEFGAIDEIIRQTVVDAIRSGAVLRVEHEARLMSDQTGFPRSEIARELTEAGISAGLNMELGDHDSFAASLSFDNGRQGDRRRGPKQA